MSELKRLEKNVVDTKAAYAAGDAAWEFADAWDAADDAAYDAAAAAYRKAKQELFKYLKEQQGNE